MRACVRCGVAASCVHMHGCVPCTWPPFIRLLRVAWLVGGVAQVMDLLGPSLWDVWSQQGQSLQEPYVACIAMEAVTILKALHEKGWVGSDSSTAQHSTQLTGACGRACSRTRP